MIWEASLVLSLALCVSSDRRPAISEQKVEGFYSGHHGDLSHIGHHEPEHHEVYAWAYPSYEFSYHVDDPHTHDNKGQHEIRDGDKVSGTYWLLQPDGRKRTVKYRSDHKTGFQAEVNYLPHDGHHYDIREDYDKHGLEEEHKEFHRERNDREEVRPERRNDWGWRNQDEHYGHKDNHRWEQNHRRSISEDERRGSGQNERRGHNDDHGHEEGPDYGADDRKQDGGRREEGNRREGQNRGRDDNRDDGLLWGIQAWGKERYDNKNNHHEGRKDEIAGLRRDRGHEEHWKHGVLVGWTEGRGREDRRRGDDRRGRDNDRGDENRRGPHSYQAPIMNFKPLVPYGQRLH